MYNAFCKKKSGLSPVHTSCEANLTWICRRNPAFAAIFVSELSRVELLRIFCCEFVTSTFVLQSHSQEVRAGLSSPYIDHKSHNSGFLVFKWDLFVLCGFALTPVCVCMVYRSWVQWKINQRHTRVDILLLLSKFITKTKFLIHMCTYVVNVSRVTKT